MQKRSWIGVFFRSTAILFILVFLALLYWSSVLQEERLRSIESSLQDIRQTISQPHVQGSDVSPQKKPITLRPLMDPSLPNLLVEDPYFTKTLPEILGKNFTVKGTLRRATIGQANDLHPFSMWANVVEYLSYCQGFTASVQFGRFDVLVQDMAIKIEERAVQEPEVASFWVHLREGMMWEPLNPQHFASEVQLSPHFLKRHPVTAHDFKFYFQAFKNPHVDVAAAATMRQLFTDMDRIEVIDDLTFVVYYKKTMITDSKGASSYKLPYAAIRQIASLTPLASFVYKYQANGSKISENDTDKDFYAKSSYWAQYFHNHFARRVIVSCGPWIFDGVSDTQIRFKRNPNYFLPTFALFENMEIYFLENPDSIWRDFMAQKIDCCEIPPQHLVDLEHFLESPFYKEEKAKGHEVKSLDYLMRMFSFVGWNIKRPLFSNKKVRQALAMAIDGKRIIQQNLNGKGVQITGPFFCLSPSYDSTIAPWSYDPDEAARLLAEEGWVDSDGDGVIDKLIDGSRVPFRFTLTYYVKNPATKANVELIANQLKSIGVDCIPHGVDLADLSAALDDKNFDAHFLAWESGLPPEDPEQIWHSRGANIKASSNTIGFANAEADHLISLLKFEQDEKERTMLYHRFHALIHEEAPYLFLYTTKMTLVYWSDLKNIFIPKDRQDLIPGATLDEPSVVHGWKE
ncbi:MAG: hypothetical protein JWO53_603 [Chlamydiia bacterium]|nr:hypothetical protein [Chlamydiia bacterium]